MINQHVTDPEHSKNLKDAGFPQETSYYYIPHYYKKGDVQLAAKIGSHYVYTDSDGLCTTEVRFVSFATAAPLATELTEKLPSLTQAHKRTDDYMIWTSNSDAHINKNLANALADLWCELHTHG